MLIFRYLYIFFYSEYKCPFIYRKMLHFLLADITPL
jgi:hypothetical protein